MSERENFKTEREGGAQKKTFAMPIIFKQLRTGPQTRISKMENVGIHHAVGMYLQFINYYYPLFFLFFSLPLHKPFIIYIYISIFNEVTFSAVRL